MEIGDKYKHFYIPSLTCQIVRFTDKGAEVKETDNRNAAGRRGKRAFYNSQDFSDKGKGREFWAKVTAPA